MTAVLTAPNERNGDPHVAMLMARVLALFGRMAQYRRELEARAEAIACGSGSPLISGDDLLQELILHLAKPRVVETLRGMKKPRQRLKYCSRAMANIACDIRRGRRSPWAVSLDPEKVAARPDDNGSRLSELLTKVADILSDEEFQMFKLKLVDGQTYREVAARTGKTQRSVYHSLRKTLRVLREHWEMLLEIMD